jgi:hypothetical protein
MHTTTAFRIAGALVAALLIAASPARAAGLSVDLKNDESRSISVMLGTDNGVTAESDFTVRLPDGQAVPFFPAELFKDRFWSAPLSPEDYGAIAAGAAVERYSPDKVTHQMMRRIAAEYGKQLLQEKASAQKWEKRKALSGLKEQRARLVERRTRVEGWIADAERGLAGDRERMERSNDGIDGDIDRAEQRIADLVDQRQELQAQRDAISDKRRGDYGRLTNEIANLGGRIASERNSLNSLRDRKRANKGFVDRDVRGKSELEAERRSLDAEIKALDLKIREAEKGGQ